MISLFIKLNLFAFEWQFYAAQLSASLSFFTWSYRCFAVWLFMQLIATIYYWIYKLFRHTIFAIALDVCTYIYVDAEIIKSHYAGIVLYSTFTKCLAGLKKCFQYPQPPLHNNLIYVLCRLLLPLFCYRCLPLNSLESRYANFIQKYKKYKVYNAIMQWEGKTMHYMGRLCKSTMSEMRNESSKN